MIRIGFFLIAGSSACKLCTQLNIVVTFLHRSDSYTYNAEFFKVDTCAFSCDLACGRIIGLEYPHAIVAKCGLVMQIEIVSAPHVKCQKNIRNFLPRGCPAIMCGGDNRQTGDRIL